MSPRPANHASDAASLYLVEPTGGHLRFAVAQNASIDIPFRSTIIEMTGGRLPATSPSGANPCASTMRMRRRRACRTLNRSFDDATGYRTQSMLAVPMRTPKGVITGVLQLINATSEGRVVPYADRQLELAPRWRRRPPSRLRTAA